jgi:chitin disaccharide deacetylase
MGRPRRDRYLVVNADDFGQSAGVNRGIIEAHEEGVVSSASLMVRWPAAAAAAAYARSRPAFSLGLHFDLCEWTCRRGRWTPLYEVLPALEVHAVRREITGQLETFRRLVGRDPTHLDSHQHVHLERGLRPVFVELADMLGVPLRRCHPGIRYCGDFYGQDGAGRPCPQLISPAALIAVLGRLLPGCTELGCHPGYARDLTSMYRRERAREVRTLCHPRVREALRDSRVHLRSFVDIADITRAESTGPVATRASAGSG